MASEPSKAGSAPAPRVEPEAAREPEPTAALTFRTEPISVEHSIPTAPPGLLTDPASVPLVPASDLVVPAAPLLAPRQPAPPTVGVDDATVALHRPAPAPAALSVPNFNDLLDRTSQPIVAPSESSAVIERVSNTDSEFTGESGGSALPPIVEATPPSSVAAALAVGDTPAPVVESPAPAVQPTPTLSLPAARPVVAPSHPVFEPAPTIRRAPRKDRSGSVARVGFFFLLVAALASAAVIFGRPYLFPEDWEPDALGFAEPIEAARGSEFVEPVILTSQPAAVHRPMVAAQLLGDHAALLPMWRSLGLAGPDSTDSATLQALISEQAPVLYSTVDGQVYVDASYTGSDRDPLITRAMATAALDQDYAFSIGEVGRTLDDAALTEAHVKQQSALIQQAAAASVPVPVTDMAALAFLPSLLDYKLTAPSVFVELLPAMNEVDANPLADLGVMGPGPLHVPALASTVSASAIVGDVAVGPAIVTDRSFWYLAFASHLDPVTSYQMSNSLESAGLQMVNGANGTCSIATFSSGDAASSEVLRSQLDAWAAATAPDLGASAVALTETTVQLRSCDPVGAYQSNAGFGVGRQLMAWRAIELAVTNEVVSGGGTDVDIAAVIARISITPAAGAVARLPAGTAPDDLANAARAAAAEVVASTLVTPGG